MITIENRLIHIFASLRRVTASMPDRSPPYDLPRDASEQTKMDATAFYNANLQKLVLWGITQDQLDKLDDQFDRTGKIPNNLIVTSPITGIVIKKNITSGDYVQIGAEPYTVADLGKLWLVLKLYERDPKRGMAPEQDAPH